MAWIDRCRDGDRVRLINSAERACRLDGAAEQRFAGAAGVDIIEVKVQLRDDAVAAAWAIDRDQRLDVELEGVADPNHAGTDERNQVIDVPYLKLYSRSRPEGVHSGRYRVFSDRRSACIGCEK